MGEKERRAAREVAKGFRIVDLHKFSQGLGLSPGITNLVANAGGIPDRGPGSKSIPNAMRRNYANEFSAPTSTKFPEFRRVTIFTRPAIY